MEAVEITCMIVDDEPMAVNLVDSYVDKTPYLTLKKKCNSAIEAMQFLNTEKVDLLFLDIQISNLSNT